MPNFDYRCPNGHEWDAIRSIDSRDESIDCPECGASGKRIFVHAPMPTWYPGCGRSPMKERLRTPQ